MERVKAITDRLPRYAPIMELRIKDQSIANTCGMSNERPQLISTLKVVCNLGI